MNSSTPPRNRQELAHRSSSGIEVTLLWSASDNGLTLQVMDLLAGEGFEMAVDPDRANHAFRHPYAYAAERGLAHQDVPRRAA